MPNDNSFSQCELILGNANRRFSGVTSTMLQCLPYQQTRMNVRVLGKHHLPNPELAVTFWQLARWCRKPLSDGRVRIFHARRNIEMLQALLLKHLFRAKLKVVFTSTAQRHHSRYTRWLISNMDAVISTCKAAASFLEKPPHIIIAHGVDTELYHPSADRAADWCSLGLSGSHGIGIFGRVRPQKGVHLFVRACIETLPEHPDFTAIIVGAIAPKDASWVDQLKQEIASAGLTNRIIFMGEQAFSHLPQLFRSVSLVAALSDNEGFGLTVLEAMSSGTAVLASQAGAWPEIVSEAVDGWLVETNNQQAVSDKLVLSLAQPELLAQMGERGRQKVLQHFTVKRESDQLCDFFKSIQNLNVENC